MVDEPSTPGRALHRALGELFAELRAKSETEDLDHSHVVLETDPETGHRQAIGPYPNAYSALEACSQLAVQHARDIGDPPATYEVIMYFRPEQYGV